MERMQRWPSRGQRACQGSKQLGAGPLSARYFSKGPGGLPRAEPASLFPGHTVRGLLGPLAAWPWSGLGDTSGLRGTPAQVASLS